MTIRLLRQHGMHAAGTTHEVVRIVPHGGHTDAAQQYVLVDGTHVCDDAAEIIQPNPR